MPEASEESIFLSCVEIALKEKPAGKSSIFSFKTSKLEEVSHEMFFCGASNSQAGRSFLRFAWQAQYFRSLNAKLARRFFVAGAALCAGASYNFVARAAFCDVARVLF